MPRPDVPFGEMSHCWICGTRARTLELGAPYRPGFDCSTCGRYALSEYAAQRFLEPIMAVRGDPGTAGYLPHDHHLLSAVIRERYEASEDAYVCIPDFAELRAAARPLPGGPLGSVDRLLRHLADRAPRVFAPVTFEPDFDHPLAYARDADDMVGIALLANQLGYVALASQRPLELTVQAGGWQRLNEIRAAPRKRRQAFVAMWFADEMAPAFNEGIAPALEDCGYHALRIDRLEHNDKIDDRIMAAIRQSGLLVADFTGHRGGVYFEAGFAMGLGIPVVRTCHKRDLSGLHFDTRQYSHVVWETPAQLRDALRARIEATYPTLG